MSRTIFLLSLMLQPHRSSSAPLRLLNSSLCLSVLYCRWPRATGASQDYECQLVSWPQNSWWSDSSALFQRLEVLRRKPLPHAPGSSLTKTSLRDLQLYHFNNTIRHNINTILRRRFVRDYFSSGLTRQMDHATVFFSKTLSNKINSTYVCPARPYTLLHRPLQHRAEQRWNVPSFQ